MTNMFTSNEEDFNKLQPNHDTDFQMEQLLLQHHRESAKYPPVKYEYDFEKVCTMVDAGMDVSDYIDQGLLDAMRGTLEGFKGRTLTGNILIYKEILDAWG